MLYGIDNETQAHQRYSNLTGQRFEECGCFNDGSLVASPDGYILELDHLLEIKGLASQRDMQVIEAVQEKQSLKSYPYGLDENGRLYLKKENS